MADWEAIRVTLRGHTPPDYQYPDADNSMEDGVIPAERRDEERALWSAWVDEGGRGDLALDAGCGLGAFTNLLADRFDHVVAVDADSRRVGTAAARHTALVDRVLFAALRLTDAVLTAPPMRQAFSLIHCMQVLGHVPRDAVGPILGAFAQLLHPLGRVVLAVPFVNHFAEEHRLVRADSAEGMDGHPVTAARYDALATHPESRVLPVRHFTAKSITRALADAGLHVQRLQPYNWYSDRRADLMVLATRAS